MLPVHQGRAAENVVFSLLLKEGQVVLGNMNFNTSKAHIKINKGISMDLIRDNALDTSADEDFKGDLDTNQLLSYLKTNGPDNVAFILLTITNNNIGGIPVSMRNIREVSRIAKEYGILLVFDAARFAENAFFIREKEESFKYKDLKGCVFFFNTIQLFGDVYYPIL